MFRRIVLSATSLIALTAAASAADISVAPAAVGYKDYVSSAAWNGFYFGVHAGSASADMTTTDLDSYWSKQIIISAPPRTTSLSSSGVFGGVQLGYNIQRGNVVFGIEADFGDMGIHSSTPLNSAIPHTAEVKLSTGAYGDLTGRLGWSFGSLMVYGKGGVALLRAKQTVEDSIALNPTFQDGHVGWTAGGGVEYLVMPNWSVKVEYQHFDFGTSSSTLYGYNLNAFTGFPSSTYGFNHDLAIDTVKVGLNYHLGCCEAPLK